MTRGGNEDGADRPAASLEPSRTSLALLGIIAAGTAVAGLFLISSEFTLHIAALWLLSAALAFGASFLHLRHVAAAALVTALPLSGALWSGAMLRLAGYPFGGVAPTCAYGLTLAAFVAQDCLRRIASDEAPERAAQKTLRVASRPVIAATACAALAILMSAPGPGAQSADMALAALVELAVVTLFSTLALAWSLGFIMPNEAFIARTNRIRERRVARAYRASMVAVPRWGMSVSGIALVFAVLAAFGAPFAALPVSQRLSTILLGSGFAFVAADLVVAGWRDALALCLCFALIGLFAGLVNWPDPLWTDPLWFAAVRIAALPVLYVTMMAQEARRWRDAGEEDSIARLRGVEEGAGTIIFAMLTASLFLLPWQKDVAPHAMLLLLPAGAAAAIFFEPALATAIETVLPRRRSVEDLYKRF